MNQRSYRRLERRIRNERPEAPEELVRSVVGRISPQRTGVPRLALGASLSLVMMVALASVGGISYAANAAKEAVKVVHKVVSPPPTIAVVDHGPGHHQYRPGHGHGDRNHIHTGPPGLTRAGKNQAGPTETRSTKDSDVKLVHVAVRVDEQATLQITVLDSEGKAVPLTHGGSGGEGEQATTISSTVLVPGTIPITLRVPARLLKAAKPHSLRVVAIDSTGLRSRLRIRIAE